MRSHPLRLCLVDMNNGVANEATRCFRRLFDAFQHKVRAANPGLEITFRHVQPRNLGELPDRNTDLILSSGGPGSPYDGYDDPWCVSYRKFIDHVVDRNLAAPDTAPGMLVVCHSFEIAVTHFAVATMVPRSSRKFGVMPCYVTEEGRRSVLFAPFGDRLFTWEHRNWEPVDLDEHKLRKLGGALLAKESREGRFDKGRALLGFDFARGVSGTQFHPEADRPGVLAWINRPEHAADVKGAYGVDLYERMIRTLSDPTRLARTYALLIPGWLAHRFNQLAEVRGLRSISGPAEDVKQFETDGSPNLPRAVGAAVG